MEPPAIWRISQSPPSPMIRAVVPGSPAPRIQKVTVPTDGGVKDEFVWAMPPVPFVFRAILPAHEVSQVAPPERVAVFARVELWEAVVRLTPANFHLPTKS